MASTSLELPVHVIPDNNGQTGTAVVYDERMGSHYHMWNNDFTEKPERFTGPFKRCREYGLLERCQNLQSRMATEEEMKILHSEDLVKLLKKSTSMTDEEMKETSRKYDFLYFHKDVYQNAGLSLGCTLDLVQHIIQGKAKNGMAIIRPPGHHAMYNEFCGYCFLNNVAIAAKQAVDHYGLKRVLVIDWDVHHGQGTQYFFYNDPRVIYFSIHTYMHGKEWPYLRESDYDHIGEGKGVGYNINVPLNSEGCSDSEYLAIFQQILLPVAYEFDPELVLVSAGYDCAIGCPEGEMEVTPACFAHFTNLLSTLASGKVCLILEGGYCIKSLSESVALSLRALLGDPCPQLQPLQPPSDSTVESVLNVIKALRPYWKCFQFQGNLQPDETPLMPALLDWPPITDMEFYTEHTRPRRYSLSQDCYDKDYNLVADHLDNRIDSIIAETSLKKAPNKLCIVYDKKMLLHKDVSSGDFEECPKRIQHIHNALVKKGLWSRCFEVKGRQATDEELALGHSPDFIRHLKKTTTMDEEALIVYQNSFDSIYLCKDSFLSASYSVGCLLSVVDSVVSEQSQHGVALIRPPGHHAEKNFMMGFCLFNNIGIAAKYAQNTYGIQRILILDWDIHHGNALQSLFYNDPSVLYISLHRYDNGSFYPSGEEGHPKHCGSKTGLGHNINIAWNDDPKSDGDYIAAFHQIILPVCYEYSPELVFVAAGFDAAAGDYMGNYMLTPAVYGHMTQMLLGLASGKLVLALEGGYNFKVSTDCMSSCVSVLLGEACQNVKSCIPSASAVDSICSTLDVHKQYWKSLKFRVNLPTEEQINKIKKKKNSCDKKDEKKDNHVNNVKDPPLT